MADRKEMHIDRARQILRQVSHPMWSPSDDFDLLTMKAGGQNFHDIADWLGRQRLAVEQRYHRLRVVPRISEALRVSGLTSEPYPAG